MNPPQTTESPKRRKWFWRLCEALAALFCLLATHQSVWVYFNRDLGDKLRAEYPNPGVWLIPREFSSSKIADVKQTEFEVTSPLIKDLDGYGPTGRELVLKVNQVDMGKASSPDGNVAFRDVPLRQGRNTILAFPLEDGLYSPRVEREPAQTVYYNPAQHDSVLVLKHFCRAQDSALVIIGAADPSTQLNWRRVSEPDSISRKLDLDHLGFFQCALRCEKTDSLGIMLWAETKNFREPNTKQPVGNKLKTSPISFPDSAQTAFQRKISFTLSPPNFFQIEASAQLPAKTVLHGWIKNRQITSEEVLRFFFGLEVSTLVGTSEPIEPFKQNFPRLEGDRLQLVSKGKISAAGLAVALTDSGALNKVPLQFPEDTIALRLQPLRPVKFYRTPEDSSSKPDAANYVWQGLREKRRYMETRLFFAPYDSTEEKKAAKAAVSKADSLAAKKEPQPASRSDLALGKFMVQLRNLERLVPFKLRDFLHALLNAIPFMWLLWVLYKHGNGSEYSVILRAATMTFFIFHLILLCVPVFSTSFRFFDPVLAILAAPQAMSTTAKDLGKVYPFLAIGIILLFRPLYSSLERPQQRARARKMWPLRTAFWLAVPLLPAALFYILLKTRLAGAAPLYPNYVQTAALFAGIGLIFCWFFLYWLLNVSLGLTIKKRTIIKVSWAMLLLPLLPLLVEACARFLRYKSVTAWKIYPFFIPTRTDNFLWFIIIVWAGAALLSQLVELAVHMLRANPNFSFSHSRPAWLLIPFFILFSLPMGYLVAPEHLREISIYDLSALAIVIDNLLPYALLVGLIIFLRKVNPEDQFDLGKVAISVGTILFAYYLIGRATSLLLAPLPLLLGWYLFTRRILMEHVKVPPIANYEERKNLVSLLLKCKQARSFVYSLQKGLKKKYAQGDGAALEAAENKAKTMHDDLKKAEDNLRAEPNLAKLLTPQATLGECESSAKHLIFGHGPESGPWENAMVALRYGLVLSIPFQLSTLVGILKQQEYANYPLLQFLTAILFSISAWVLIAFVFGYFFHKIKGRDGFTKAIVFTMAYLIATIPLRLINLQPLLEQGFVVQMVQIIAYVLLLALVAFDLRCLQKLDFTWRELLEVHGFTTITAYGSSIVLATVASLSGKDLLPLLWNTVTWLLNARGQ